VKIVVSKIQQINKSLTLLDPGGDGEGGNADAQLIKGEAIGGHLNEAGKKERRKGKRGSEQGYKNARFDKAMADM